MWLPSFSKSTSDEESTRRDSFPAPIISLRNPYILCPLSIALSLGSIAAYRRYLRRIPNSDFVLPRHLRGEGRSGRLIKGKVTSVGDADNFRLYHTPGIGWGWLRPIPSSKADLKDQTLHIRLAGVDAPELAHFGNPAQPFSSEALDWLKSRLLGKTVKVRLLSKDRYGRIVGMTYDRTLPIPWRRSVSLDMLKAGYATVYTAAGAEYGGMLEKFQQAEAQAKRKKIGMWSQSTSTYESPAEYKRRHSSDSLSSSSSSASPDEKKGAGEEPQVSSGLWRVFGGAGEVIKAVASKAATSGTTSGAAKGSKRSGR